MSKKQRYLIYYGQYVIKDFKVLKEAM
jgi:hypothetical protein